MLENTPPAPPPDSSSSSSAAAVKRYAPPYQRNRSLSRRKSGDRFDRSNSIYSSDGEKNQHTAPRNIPVVEQVDAGSSNLLNENSRPGLIPLEGCCRSEASQLLNDRWATVLHKYNDPSVDLSERPVMYSGSSVSACGQLRLPHQFMSPSNNAGSKPQLDFLSELRRAIRAANANSDH